MLRLQSFGARVSGAGRAIPTWLAYCVGLLPGAWVFVQIFRGDFIEPLEVVEHRFGRHALQFLIASLMITPLMRFARISLVKYRKILGLLGFGYLTGHFLIWLVLDLQLRWGAIGADIARRPYITVGFIAFILLIPVAATSWQGAIRRMGPVAWGRLHRLVYIAVLLGAVHFIMQERVWTVESLIYLFLVIALIGMRGMWIRRW